jgi:peptide/nickel transport system permease protein
MRVLPMPQTSTDYLFLGLMLVMAGLFFVSLRQVSTRRALERLLLNPSAVASGLILWVFLGIGVLDCVHTTEQRWDGHDTYLDKFLAPLGQRDEKTFSAPMALHLYQYETRWVDGRITMLKPRLNYPAVALDGAQMRHHWIQQHVLYALAGVGIWCLLCAMMAGFLRRRWDMARWHLWRPSVRAAAVTGAILVFVAALLYGLSREFHVLGTGKIGQDILYYALKSIRTALMISILTTLFTLPFALILGVAAGYFGGWIDDMIQYLYTTISSIPGVLLISASVLSMQAFIVNHPLWFRSLAEQADARLLALCVILGVSSWTGLCRLLRAEALKLKHIDYVVASRLLGVSSWRVLTKHLLPNVMHIVMITLILDFSYLILAEALLTYVGVGVSPMTMSWGNMINSARLELARDPMVWWPMVAAFVFMLTLVLASNVFADALEKAWNPRST